MYLIGYSFWSIFTFAADLFKLLNCSLILKVLHNFIAEMYKIRSNSWVEVIVKFRYQHYDKKCVYVSVKRIQSFRSIGKVPTYIDIRIKLYLYRTNDITIMYIYNFYVLLPLLLLSSLTISFSQAVCYTLDVRLTFSITNEHSLTWICTCNRTANRALERPHL